MITEASGTSIIIEFEQKDWRNGLARHMIDGIKAFPYTTRRYNGDDKKWYINPSVKNRASLMALYTDWELSLPYHWSTKEDEEAEDIKEFLEQFN